MTDGLVFIGLGLFCIAVVFGTLRIAKMAGRPGRLRGWSAGYVTLALAGVFLAIGLANMIRAI